MTWIQMKRWEGDTGDMAGRLTKYEDGVVTGVTGEMMLGPDVREAGERYKAILTEIDIALGEARRSFIANDAVATLTWVKFARGRAIDGIEMLNRDLTELDARMAENRAGFLRAFPTMRILATRRAE